MRGTSASTSLINQLVQVMIPPPHVLTAISYTMKRNKDRLDIELNY